ncbi:hypothetical protein [Sphingorhabdus buctiana]
MEGTAASLNSEVRSRLDEAGLHDVDITAALADMASGAQRRHTMQAVVKYGSLITGFIIGANILFDGQPTMPGSAIIGCLFTAAVLSEISWTAYQYRDRAEELDAKLKEAVAPLKDDIAAERWELHHGNEGPLTKKIVDNRYFYLLLSQDIRHRELVRLPWGGLIKEPLTLRRTSRQLLNSIAPSDPTMATPEIAPPFARQTPSRTGSSINLNEPGAAQVGDMAQSAKAKPIHNVELTKAKPRQSSAQKRAYITVLTETKLRAAVASFLSEGGIPLDHHDMYMLAVETIWRCFCENQRDDYTVMDAVRAAASALENKFGRVALGLPRDNTGDQENADVIRQRKPAEQDSNAWIKHIAYGTNPDLKKRLEEASGQLTLTL